jgi:hypothetical protein
VRRRQGDRIRHGFVNERMTHRRDSGALVWRDKPRAYPSVRALSKRRDRDRRVDFPNGLDDAQQLRSSRPHFAASDVQGVGVHEEQHVQEFQYGKRERVCGEGIPAHPPRDPAETPER